MIYGFGYGGLCALYLPVLMTVIGVFGMKVKKSALDRMNVIKHLGGIAEESLTAIKVVASFGREEREQTKFQHWCEESTKVSKIATRTMSFMIGLMKFTTFTFYTYAMLLGTRYILYHDYSQQ
jgi:ABC-type multidrug transport system fused ATPase/permease subunit